MKNHSDCCATNFWPISALQAWSLSLLTMVFFSCCSTTSSQSILEIPADQRTAQNLQAFREIFVRCEERSCQEFSPQGCREKLIEKAACAGADAFKVTEYIEEGTGHAGAEIVAYSCKGVAFRRVSKE